MKGRRVKGEGSIGDFMCERGVGVVLEVDWVGLRGDGCLCCNDIDIEINQYKYFLMW